MIVRLVLASLLVSSVMSFSQTPTELSSSQALLMVDSRTLQAKDFAQPLAAEGMITYRISVGSEGAITRLQRVGNSPDSDFRSAADGFVPGWRFVRKKSDPAIWSAFVGVCYAKDMGKLLACVPPDAPDTSGKPTRLVIPGTQAKRQFSGSPLNRLKGSPIERSSDTVRARIQGVAEVTALITPEGKVREVTAFRGHPMLVDSAVATVKKWQFAPVVFMGSPVEVQLNLWAALAEGD